MLKQIIEMVITGTVIFIGISIAIGLLILIVSSLEDFFFGTKNSSQEGIKYESKCKISGRDL